MCSADASMLRGLQRHDWHVDVVRISAVMPVEVRVFGHFVKPHWRRADAVGTMTRKL